MSSPKHIVLDLGGVVINFNGFRILSELTNLDLSPDTIEAWWRQSPIIHIFDAGKIDSLEFADLMIAEFDLDFGPLEFIREFKSWVVGFYPGAVDLISLLRQRYTVSCLSNSNESHWSENIYFPFDNAYSSHLIGLAKPDKTIFEYLLNELAEEPQNIIFFDDSLANVSAAIELGITAHHTVGLDSLRDKLTDLALF